MMRSMFSGVSGLRVHQTKMDVIANNIANVNTVGYKSSRVTFNEVFSQTLGGASGANPAVGRGGRNPMQIGLGVNVSSIDLLMTTGASQRTDGAYDLMIDGDGFFILSDTSGTYFSRAGAFRIDEFGNLTNPQGLMVMGWKAVPGEGADLGKNVISRGEVGGISISGPDTYIDPVMTTRVNVEGNLNTATDPKKESTISFYDSLGNNYVMRVKYEYNKTTNQWDMYVGNYMYPNDDRTKGVRVEIGDDGSTDANGVGNMTLKTSTAAATSDGWSRVAFGDDLGFIKFNDLGYPITSQTDGVPADGFMTQLKITIDDTLVAGTPPTGGVLSPDSRFSSPITIDFTGLTQFNATTDAAAYPVDGNKPGTLEGITIGSDGIVTGRYSNGKVKTLAQIAITKFKNPAGLQKAGSNLYVQTPNSGLFDGIGEAPSSLLAGTLEMANVDLAAEFTDMITTQRGFQANSRVITTSDEMLQELVNLKR